MVASVLLVAMIAVRSWIWIGRNAFRLFEAVRCGGRERKKIRLRRTVLGFGAGLNSSDERFAPAMAGTSSKEVYLAC